MPTHDKTHPTQPIGGTILVVMMEVDPAHEDDERQSAENS